MRLIAQAQREEDQARAAMRQATVEDLPQVLEWFIDYYIENQQRMPMNVDVNAEQTMEFFRQALSHPDKISYISDDGVILGELGHTWFGPTRVARGVLWYVRPEARNGLLARSLLKNFDREAKERGAQYAKYELDNPAHLGKIDGLLKLQGYDPYSKIYVKRF